MIQADLEQIALQLESQDSRDRMLALVRLRQVSPQDALPLIKKVLNDKVLQVRSMAVFALGVKPTEESYPMLVKCLQTDPDYGIRADAAGALGYLEDKRAFEPLVRAFYEETQWLVRFSAAVALGNIGDIRARKVLMEALYSQESVMEQAAIAALGEIGAMESLDDILSFIDSEDWLVRQRLAEALRHLPCEKSASALQYLVKDDHSQVSEAALFAIDSPK
ncbi:MULTISPECIES: HEAT repeat domain-containing protein [Spirulina sp. CCY15215]|uniref:HEAT repeat domain-containing protein n=1 Tax=Spirulina sp. CCY15215 TaxID=2767591 RepID=UPI00195096C5|nr:HEAT repeat domain-containing protein [Spirulina major]